MRQYWTVRIPGYAPFRMLGHMNRADALEHIRGIWPQGVVE
ncbi:hypothetical protein Psm1vBMR14_gp32c [Pseudomonas phage MR14]|nr:hypothetical protein Psm1vBMR14_gp32c [Pseudomonas phage MR14]